MRETPPSQEPTSAQQLKERLSARRHRLPLDQLRRGQSGEDTNLQGKSEQGLLNPNDYLQIKAQLHERLIEHFDERGLLGATDPETIVSSVNQFLESVVDSENIPFNAEERASLARELSNETLGVGPLAPLMNDPAITDILVNGPSSVYVERYGRLEKTGIRFRDNEHLVRLIQRIVSGVGRRIDEGSPYVDARLPDGSRVNATLPPVTVDGPTLSIRRFGRNRLSTEDFINLRTLSPEMLTFLEFVVLGRQNVVISGGTGAGKSTLLSAIAKFVPESERIITIEDTAELQLAQAHVVRCETRPPNTEGQGEVSCRDLLRNALRMRPDRIIVGEVRGAEAFDMLQAMNTGHEGSMTTLHANSPRDGLSRLENMVLMAGAELPSRAVREQFVSALDLAVHVERHEDGVRRVVSIVEITGMEGETPQLQEIFRFERLGLSGREVDGRFVPTGIVPRFVEKLQRRGIPVPYSIFNPPGAR